MKIICTEEKEKEFLIRSIATSHSCIFLDTGIHTIDECRNGDGCIKCIANSIEWEVKKHEL